MHAVPKNQRAAKTLRTPGTCEGEQLAAAFRHASKHGHTNRPDSKQLRPEFIDRLWRQAHHQIAPGVQHAVERRCNASSPRVSIRADWVAQTFMSAWRTRNRPDRGGWIVAELGPCAMPTQFQAKLVGRYRDRVQTRTIDFTNDTEVLAQNCFKPMQIDIVSDAQTMVTVPSEYFDALIAFHVLEHMVDPLGAVESWLRVVRPGGVVVFAIPDVCGGLINADKLRTTASPSHFVADHEFAVMNANSTPGALLARGIHQHGDEVSLSVATYILDMPAHVLKEADKALAASAPCPGKRIAYQPYKQMMHWARQRALRSRDVHQGHFHAWSVSTLRAMLEAARPVLKVHFRVIDIFTAERNPFQMQELHVALQRVA